MAEIKFVNVTKYFGPAKVIENLNLKIQDSKFLVLVGHSGCGKTITLRLLAGPAQLRQLGKLSIYNRNFYLIFL